jgi:hypothetical protein
MLDVITVVFQDELGVLPVQAASMARYLNANDIGTVWVVVNDTTDLDSVIDPAWWGPLQNRVRIHHVNTHQYNNGWVTQQLCKLLTAAEATQPWSMVVDAKTVFVRDWQFCDVMTDSGMAVGTLPIFPVFEQSQQLIQRLFDIEFDQQLGPGGVPFFFHTETVQNMIADIESRTDQEFGPWFLSQGRITEFMLYSGWVLKQHGSFEPLYHTTRSFDVENVCHSEVTRFDQKLEHMQTHPVLTVSVHREAWRQLTEQQQQRYRNFLIGRELKEAQQL